MQNKVIKGLVIGAILSGLAFVSGCGSSTETKAQAPIQPPTQAQEAAKKVEDDASKYITVIRQQNQKIYQLSKDGRFAEAKNEFKALDDAFYSLKPSLKNEELKKKLDHAIDEIGDELKKEKPRRGEIEEEYEVIIKVLKDVEGNI